MVNLLVVASIAEFTTGLALVAAHSVACELLFESGLPGVAAVVARVVAISLMSLGVACWPVRSAEPAWLGMIMYDALGSLDLAQIEIRGEWVGHLLWAAAARSIAPAVRRFARWS